MTYEILRKVAMLEDIEEATSECILTWACRVEVHRTQSIALKVLRKLRNFMSSPKNVSLRPHAVTNDSIVGQDIHPGSALHM